MESKDRKAKAGGVCWRWGSKGTGGGRGGAETFNILGLFSGVQSTKGQLIQCQTSNVQHRNAVLQQ